jgi:hypothetical protein
MDWSSSVIESGGGLLWPRQWTGAGGGVHKQLDSLINWITMNLATKPLYHEPSNFMPCLFWSSEFMTYSTRLQLTSPAWCETKVSTCPRSSRRRVCKLMRKAPQHSRAQVHLTFPCIWTARVACFFPEVSEFDFRQLGSRLSCGFSWLSLVPPGKGKGRGKVVPVLLLTENHAMKACWGSGGIAQLIIWPRQ